MSQNQQQPEPKFCTEGPPADVNECAEITAAEYKHWADAPEEAAVMAIGATGAAANILCAINGFRAPWHPEPKVGRFVGKESLRVANVSVRAPQPDNEDAQTIISIYRALKNAASAVCASADSTGCSDDLTVVSRAALLELAEAAQKLP